MNFIPALPARFSWATTPSPTRRIIVTAGVAGIVGVGILGFVLQRPQAPVASSLQAVPASQDGTGLSGSTPQRRSEVREASAAAAQDASRRNASNVADVEDSWKVQQQRREELTRRRRQMEQSQAAPPSPDLEAKTKAFLIALNSAMGAMRPTPGKASVTLTDEDLRKLVPAQETSTTTAVQPAAARQQVRRPDGVKDGKHPLGLAGRRVAAFTVLAAKVDPDSGKPPAVVEITSGPLAGYRLQGTIEKHENGLTVDLNTLFYNGQTVPVDAILLAPETQDINVFCDIDRHLPERVGIPALVGAAQGLGQAAQLSGSTFASGPYGGVAAYSQFNPMQIAGQALGGAANGVQSTLREALPKGSTVTLCANASVYVYFRNEVYLPD